MKIRISPVANAQLEDIHEYTFGRWGDDQALNYSKGLVCTINDIASGAARSRPIAVEMGVPGFVCRFESHYVYWQSRPDAILVVAVLYRSMEQSTRLRAALNDV